MNLIGVGINARKLEGIKFVGSFPLVNYCEFHHSRF